MRKIKIVTFIIGALLVSKLIHKYLLSDKFWWINLFKKGQFEIEGKKYYYKDMLIIDYYDFDIDQNIAKLNVIFEYQEKQFLYEAIYNKTKKIEIIDSNKKDLNSIIVSKNITIMSANETQRWINENELGI